MNRPGSDDEPEVEVVRVPAPAPKPAPAAKPAPRRRSGLADEPIESGEIVPLAERRSLVIRSQPQLERIDDPSPPAARPVAPAKSRLPYLVLAGAVLAAAAGFVVPTFESAKPSTEVLAAATTMIAATIDGEARAAMSRADAIATTPMLRAGIETDAQTLADMARDQDLVFPVKGKEVVEVFRIVDGKRQSMLRVPADGRALEPGPAGKVRLDVRVDQGPAMVAAAKIAKANVDGEVAIGVPLDLEPIRQRLADSVHEAVLVGLAVPVVIVKSSGEPGTVVTMPVKTTNIDGQVSLAAIVRAESGTKLAIVRYAAFGLGGLLLSLFLFLVLRR